MNRLSLKRQVGKAIIPIALLGALVISQAPMRASAQATPMPGMTSAGTISVTGIGEVTVTPDTANIQIGVQVFSEELADAQKKSNDQIAAILETIKAAGIAEKDIQTSNFSVSIRQQYDNNGIATAVLGYDIYNTLSVTVRNLDDLGTILDQVVAAGANQIYGIYFYTTDLTKATAQAREAAVKDAQERAGQLAEAAGVQVGSIVNITEGYPAVPYQYQYGKGAGMDMAAGSAVPIQTGSQTVQISVSITYEIAQ